MAGAAKKRSGARKRTSVKDLPIKKVGADKARSVKGGAANIVSQKVATRKDLGLGLRAPTAADGSV